MSETPEMRRGYMLLWQKVQLVRYSLKTSQKGRVASEGIKLSKKAFTEPNLPSKVIAEKDGVKIVYYTKGGDHGPPHVHVKGGGLRLELEVAGKPLRNNPSLSSQQSDVISQFKSEINKAKKK